MKHMLLSSTIAVLLTAPVEAQNVSFEDGMIEQLRCDTNPTPFPFFEAIDKAGRLETNNELGYDSVSCYPITGGITVRGMNFDVICGFEEDRDIVGWSDYFYRGPGTSPGQSLSLLSLSNEAEMMIWVRDTLKVSDPERHVGERFLPGDERPGSEVSCNSWMTN